MRVGYTRRSVGVPDIAADCESLSRAGCAQVFQDNASGAEARPMLRQARDMLGAGDVLIVPRLDVFGPSLGRLVRLLDELGQRSVGFASLAEGINSADREHVYVFAAALARFERDGMRERALLGQAAARRLGRRGGRPSQVTAEVRRRALAMLAERVPVRTMAGQLGVSPQSLYRSLGDEIQAARAPQVAAE